MFLINMNISQYKPQREKKTFEIIRTVIYIVLLVSVAVLFYIKNVFITWDGVINRIHVCQAMNLGGGNDFLWGINNSKQEKTYQNVAAMQNDIELRTGAIVRTEGYYNPNDGGNARYLIRRLKPEEVIDNGKLIRLRNGNVAELMIEGRMSIMQFGAKKDIEVDNSPMINMALKNAKSVLIPEGCFGIGSVIYLHSGNDLQFDGELYVNTGKRTVAFYFFDGKTVTPGYSGVRDVYIHGKGVYNANGVLAKNSSTPFRVHHCKNITIEGITIRDYYYFHAIEVGGTDGFTCRNVTFSGAIPVVNNPMEAIQIEVITKDGTSGAIPYDGTPTKNVLIESCWFKASDTNESIMRCPIGIHSYTKNRPYSNIEITKCVFETSDQRNFGAINFMCTVKNLKIHKNLFVTKGRKAIDLYNKTTDAVIVHNVYY